MARQPHGTPALGPTTSTLTSMSQQHGTTNNSNSKFSEASPLPPIVQRSLGDRSNEKRKNAALEIEALVKSLTEAGNFAVVGAVIAVLAKDFCNSMNSNYRKGGLVGLAAAAIGLQSATGSFLHVLLPPVLHLIDDPEARVRYYATESIYNIAKVSRQSILAYFNPIFEGLAKLYADVDVDCKNGANLLDRLIKDIVTEAETESFQVDQFLPVMQNYIRRTNPYIRQLIVGWITLLDSLPDISMLDYLQDFLDGLFNFLSDTNREIRQAADSALSDFLRELSVSQVLEFGPIISILVSQCQSKERLNRLTAITWLAELTHHPYSGGDALLPYSPEILSAILYCISDMEREIRLVAERTNDDLLQFVRETKGQFELRPLLDALTKQLLEKEDVPTKMASLRWINMLMEKRMHEMQVFTVDLLPVLLRTLSDPSDAVVLLDLQVLSRISLAAGSRSGEANPPVVAASSSTLFSASDGALDESIDQPLPVHRDASSSLDLEEAQFQLVLNAILKLFAQDRHLLETRGSLIIRKLCVLLNAKSVYIRMAETLSSYEFAERNQNENEDPSSTLQFISTMVQTLNLILLTASELDDLRSILANSFEDNNAGVANGHNRSLSTTSSIESEEDGNVFATLFHCWCHNPVSTFSLCLLAKAYDLSFALVKRFSDMEDITVGFLMQIDKLVHLLESPIFIHLRLQLLNVEAPYHAQLLKSIYGILMCLPQGDAFRLLNDRLTTVCNLRENLGISSSSVHSIEFDTAGNGPQSIVSKRGLDMDKLLARFDTVMDRHVEAKAQGNRIAQQKLETAAADLTMSSAANGAHAATGPLVSSSSALPSSVSNAPGFAHRLAPLMTNTTGSHSLQDRQVIPGIAPTRISVHQTSPREFLR
jgi:vacuole morphology and inheritance protein 14